MRDVIRVMDVSKSFGAETVLMKCICGFLAPDSGEITVNYQRIGKDTDFPKDTGIIIETPGFLPNLTGLKNLELLAALQKKVSRETIRQVIIDVGLDPDLKKTVSKYSLGMRQRLGIAQALMEDTCICKISDVTSWFPPDRLLFDHLDLSVRTGERILITGHVVCPCWK